MEQVNEKLSVKERFTAFFDKRTKHSLGMVILGSFIYSVGVVWFLNVGGFFAGGVTGISQLVSRFAFGKITPLISILIGVINLPLFLIGWRGVSKKFAVLTLISVGVQMTLIAIFQFISNDLGFNPLESVVYLQDAAGEIVHYTAGHQIGMPIYDNGGRLIVAILGGCIVGFGSAICLKSGGSSGGMDVIANYLMVQKNISFVRYSFVVDLIIISTSSFFGIETALFTIIRLICSTLLVNHIYTIYRIVKMEIITEYAKDIRDALLTKFHHGMTIYTVTGGYTMKEKQMLEVFISAYEVQDYISLIESIDKKAFITVSGLENLKGNYVKKTIV